MYTSLKYISPLLLKVQYLKENNIMLKNFYYEPNFKANHNIYSWLPDSINLFDIKKNIINNKFIL